MKTAIKCSDDAKQCVVIAVMEKNGELHSLADLPTICECESCDHYYDRCQPGVLERAFTWTMAMARKI